MDPAMTEHLLELIRDEHYFTARGLRQLQLQTGSDPEFLAVVIAIPTALHLMAGAHAHFFCNAILTVVPLLLTFVFVKERPLSIHLLIYWSCYCSLSLFDKLLQEMPAYYLTKACLMACLFLRPYVWIDKLTDFVRAMDEGHSFLEQLNNPSTDVLTARKVGSTYDRRQNHSYVQALSDQDVKTARSYRP